MSVRFVFISGSILNHEKYENGKQKLRLGPIEKKLKASFLTTNTLRLFSHVTFPPAADADRLANNRLARRTLFARLLGTLGETRRDVVPSWLFFYDRGTSLFLPPWQD